MRGLSLVCLAAAGLIAAAASASAQEPANQSAAQNVRASQQYESLLCTNPAFRAKRIAQECGPLTDPQLHQRCRPPVSIAPGCYLNRRDIRGACTTGRGGHGRVGR